MILMVIKALSIIDLPSIKADCSGDIHLSINSFNLLASSLDTILYKTLQREMGRKSRIDSGLSHLGINHILVSFKLVGK
jgi:hypothetical protein